MFCNHHVDRSAAIERKKDFRLTHREVHVWEVCRPLNSHHLARLQTCPAYGEISFAPYLGLSLCASAVPGNCGLKQL